MSGGYLVTGMIYILSSESARLFFVWGEGGANMIKILSHMVMFFSPLQPEAAEKNMETVAECVSVLQGRPCQPLAPCVPQQR